MTTLLQCLSVTVAGAVLSLGISYLYDGGKRAIETLSSFFALPTRSCWLSTLGTASRLRFTGKRTVGAMASLPPPIHRDTFPPSCRERLLQAAQQSPSLSGCGVGLAALDDAEARTSLLAFEADYRNCDPLTVTPTQISIGEIKSLGDFPDYAALSGVPLPEAYHGFNIKTALPRPYRPFRWAYNQTMSLAKMEKDWWLEVDCSYAATVASRIQLFEKHGERILDYLPGSELAAKELMEMAIQFYCARYPIFFSLTKCPERGYIFRNALLKTSTVISDHHPLHILLRNVPEDFAIMLRNPDDGYYYLRGGIICSSLGWNLGTKLGMRLDEIHAPIPNYKEKMQFSMDRYFSKLATDRPIQRGSWGLEVGCPLYMPPGDPHEAHRQSQSSDLSLSRCHLRVDRQALRRASLSGAIIFNFKALFTPVTEFRDESHIPSILKKILQEGNPDIMKYKNTWHVEHVVVPALEEWEREQKINGLVDKNWEISTLDESPMFPGWQEKWHRQQGF